jgi:hypothetical protein
MAVIYVYGRTDPIYVDETAAQIDELVADCPTRVEDAADIAYDEPVYSGGVISQFRSYRFIRLHDSQEGHELRVFVSDLSIWGD